MSEVWKVPMVAGPGRLKSLGSRFSLFGLLSSGLPLVFFLLLMSGSSASAATPDSHSTLFKNGIFAASYGQISLLSGSVAKKTFIAPSLNVGWQLSRFGPLRFLIGYAVNGLGPTLVIGNAPKVLRYNLQGLKTDLHWQGSGPFTVTIGSTIAQHGLGRGTVRLQSNADPAVLEDALQGYSWRGELAYRLKPEIYLVLGVIQSNFKTVATAKFMESRDLNNVGVVLGLRGSYL